MPNKEDLAKDIIQILDNNSVFLRKMYDLFYPSNGPTTNNVLWSADNGYTMDKIPNLTIPPEKDKFGGYKELDNYGITLEVKGEIFESFLFFANNLPNVLIKAGYENEAKQSIELSRQILNVIEKCGEMEKN